MKQDDLSDLRTGDEVALRYPSLGRNYIYKIKSVEKLTSTGLIKIDGEYYTPGGQKRGGSYGSPALVRLTDEIRSEMERQQLAFEVNRLLAKCKIDNLPIDTLRALRAALEEKEL